MNILILNGSPRSNGKVSTLLHYAESIFKENEHTVDYIDVCSINFSCCKGCMACRTKGTCMLPQDDAHIIENKITKCDLLIVGTPVYWGNMNGRLKCLFDRLVGVMMAESKYGIPIPLHKNKKAMVVIACTTPFPFNIFAGQSTKAFTAIREILHYSGFKITGKIILAGTKEMKKIPDKFFAKVKRIVNKMCL